MKNSMILDYFYGQTGELFSFYRIPKALFQEPRFQSLSTDAKILYGILLDRMSLSVKNGWLDEQNRVFIIFTIEDVKRALCCADNKATKLLRELEKFGLIERKRRGLGKPSLVYVKNFSAESSKSIFQNRDFHDSGGFKIACQDPSKSRCNKTKENDTEMSETDPFYSEEAEGMSKRTQLEEYFSQSLEVELLLRLYPDDEDTLYQIVNLLVDTCATNRKTLRIAGDDKPAEVVRSRFMKLNADHALKKEMIRVIQGTSGLDREMIQQMVNENKEALLTAQTNLADSEKKLKEIEEQNQKAERNCSDLFTWASTYKGASFERRQAILKQFIKEVRVGRDYNIEIVLNVPLDEFEEFKRHAASAGRGKNQKNKSQNPQKVGRCTSNAGIVVLDKTAGETVSIVPKNAAHAILRC